MDRPTLGRVWAKDGKVTPFNDDKYEKGFVAEVPTYENLNYLQQKLDLSLKALAERGVFEWGEDVDYQTGALVWSNNIVYIALTVPSKQLRPEENKNQWGVSVIQLTRDEFDSLVLAVDNHIADLGNPHKVTAEQLNVYRRNAVDNLFYILNKNINDHKADKTNPHKVTAAQAGAVPVVGGTYTGQVTFEADETVLHTAAGDQAITSKDDLVGFRKDNVRVGLTPDKRLVRKDGEVITDVYMSEAEYVEKRKTIEFNYSSPSPDFQMDLSTDISIKRGVGISEFTRPSSKSYVDRSGVPATASVDMPTWTSDGMSFLKTANENLVVPAKGNITGFKDFTIYLEFVPSEECELYSDNSPKADRIYVNSTGNLVLDLYTPANVRRSFVVGKVIMGKVNRFAFSLDGSSLILMLNGVSVKTSTAFEPNKTYTEFYLAKNSSVSLRQLKVWSIPLTEKQLSGL